MKDKFTTFSVLGVACKNSSNNICFCERILKKDSFFKTLFPLIVLKLKSKSDAQTGALNNFDRRSLPRCCEVTRLIRLQQVKCSTGYFPFALIKNKTETRLIPIFN